LQREWSKLQVAQQKLALQQERLKLDQELLENEKRNFRRNNKLKKTTTALVGAHHSRMENMNYSPSVTFMTPPVPSNDDRSLIAKLEEQLGEAEVKLQQRDTSANELQKTLEEQLAATQRSLASILVEKDSLRLERDNLQKQVDKPPARYSSITRCEKCAQQQIKMERLQDELESLKLESSTYEDNLEGLKAQHQDTINHLKNEVTCLRQEKEALESELQSAREVETGMHQERMGEQSKQLEDYKLMISRSKLLLEDATAKSERLITKCSNLEAKIDEQQELIQALQTSKEKWEQKHDELEQEYHALKEDHRKQSHSSSNHSTISELSDDGDGTANSAIVIPLDDSLVSSSLIRSGMKHVVEWQWTNRKGIMGLFTGWVDLSGHPHGHGTWRIEDGSIYDGEWKRGLRDGKFCAETVRGSRLFKVFSRFLITLFLLTHSLQGAASTRQSMAIYIVEDGATMRKTDVECTCGPMVKCSREITCTEFVKEKGRFSRIQ
jgi:hypothetical protein